MSRSAFASTMMDDFPLTLQLLLRHGQKVHGSSDVIENELRKLGPMRYEEKMVTAVAQTSHSSM